MTAHGTLEEEEVSALVAAYRTLAKAGLIAEGQRNSLNALASAVYAQGWRYGLDFLGGSYRAEIFVTSENRATTRIQKPGTTMEAALALALAAAFALSEAPGE
ncbi:MAG: hypothetical protein AB7V46_04210 [Thermomicrobiales bacterium]